MNTIVDNYTFTEYDGESEHYRVPEGTVTLEDNAFYDRSYLRELEIPESVDYIGDYAFKICFRMESIILPAKVKHFGMGVFQQCHRLRQVALPYGVRHIDAGMLLSCHSLTEITIPDSVEKIDASAFSSCAELSIIHLSPEMFMLLPDGAKVYGALTYMKDSRLRGDHVVTSERAVNNSITNFARCNLKETVNRLAETENRLALEFLVNDMNLAAEEFDAVLDLIMDSKKTDLISVLLDAGSLEIRKTEADSWDPFA